MQSKQVLEWQAEARKEAKAEGRVEQQRLALIDAITARFGKLSDDFVERIGAIPDLARLSGLLVIAVRCSSLDEFRKELGI